MTTIIIRTMTGSPSYGADCHYAKVGNFGYGYAFEDSLNLQNIYPILM